MMIVTVIIIVTKLIIITITGSIIGVEYHE